MPRSLALATDLDVLALDRVIERRDGFLLVRSPGNPTFYWGNFLLFDREPAPGDGPRWEALFDEAFGDDPRVKHRTFAWDRTDGVAGRGARGVRRARLRRRGDRRARRRPPRAASAREPRGRRARARSGRRRRRGALVGRRRGAGRGPRAGTRGGDPPRLQPRPARGPARALPARPARRLVRRARSRDGSGGGKLRRRRDGRPRPLPGRGHGGRRTAAAASARASSSRRRGARARTTAPSGS